MINKKTNIVLRSTIWFVAAAFSLASLVGAPLIHTFMPLDNGSTLKMRTLKDDLAHLGLAPRLNAESVTDLFEYQRATNKSLSSIINEPGWMNKLGLKGNTYKATWYLSNPFDLLPTDLQQAIKGRKTPFRTRSQVWEWCRKVKAPKIWKQALKQALIETTPENLWRASRGLRPYAKNGQFLEPIIIDRGNGKFEVRDGHIATDPRYIPTGSQVLLLVRIDGRDRILKVKATDIGGAIKGRHVDLPIHLSQDAARLPHTRFPRERIRNATVQILKVSKPN